MKLLRLVLALGFELIVKLTRAQATGGSGRPSALGVGVTWFAAEGVVDVGVTQVHAIANEDEQTGQRLIDKLEADVHVTGETHCLPRPCRAHKWVTRPTASNGGSNWHQMEPEALRYVEDTCLTHVE